MNTTKIKELSRHKRNSFMLNCAVLVVISLFLALYFGIRLYGCDIPPALAPYQIIVVGMISPFQALSQLITPHLPANLKVIFPEMSAALFFSSLTGQPVSRFSEYKGVIDWVTLFSILGWQFFLMAGYYCAWYVREGLSLEAVQDALTSVQENRKTQPDRSSTTTTHTPVNPPPPSPSKGVTDAQIKNRLNESRNLTQKTPQIQRPTQQDWQTYKQNEGHLINREMIRQLQAENQSLRSQKDELQSTFSQYFSPDVLKYLEKNKPSYEGMQNQQHDISVLFCDVRGFSQYSQSVSSEEVVAYLGEYFEIASYSILHRYHGVISKLMGDGFMAYWGFPMATPDHAYIATQAALTILQEVKLRNELKPDQKPIEIGIGIASGSVMVGNIGSMDFKDFTLIGVPVNLAARLQETTKTLGNNLLISQNTFEALQGRIPCHHWGETEIRGWQNPESVYTPIIQK